MAADLIFIVRDKENPFLRSAFCVLRSAFRVCALRFVLFDLLIEDKTNITLLCYLCKFCKSEKKYLNFSCVVFFIVI